MEPPQQLQGPSSLTQPEKPSQPPRRGSRRSPPSLEALPRWEFVLGTSPWTCPPHWTPLKWPRVNQRRFSPLASHRAFLHKKVQFNPYRKISDQDHGL